MEFIGLGENGQFYNEPSYPRNGTHIFLFVFVCPAEFSSFLLITHFSLSLVLGYRWCFGGDAVTELFSVTLFKPVTLSVLETLWFLSAAL